MTTQIEAMKMMVEAITEMNDLISETSGVYGLHLNGDPSPWGEIEAGGRFERLTLKDDALAAGRAAIEAAEKVEPCGKIVKATGSLKDMHIITWEDWYRPECGDKLYTNPPSAEIEELRKDAARYRFLRQIDANGIHVYNCQSDCSIFGGELDYAIDAYMKEKQP